MTYHATIAETPARDGTFLCRCGVFQITSRDPEYDMANKLTVEQLPDGPIQFFRGTTPSLFFRSIHRAAKWRIELGQFCPYRLVRRVEGTREIYKNPVGV